MEYLKAFLCGGVLCIIGACKSKHFHNDPFRCLSGQNLLELCFVQRSHISIHGIHIAGVPILSVCISGGITGEHLAGSQEDHIQGILFFVVEFSDPVRIGVIEYKYMLLKEQDNENDRQNQCRKL